MMSGIFDFENPFVWTNLVRKCTLVSTRVPMKSHLLTILLGQAINGFSPRCSMSGRYTSARVVVVARSHDGQHAVGLSRRGLLSAAALTTITGLATSAASASVVPRPEVTETLVWGSGSAKAACTAAEARAAFGPKFVNYLARFLLAYDISSRRLWRARAAEIPLSWSEQRVGEARLAQLGEFLATVEGGLCDFCPAEGKWSCPLTPRDAASVRRLLSLLRSRYGSRPDALRQLALLFSLLPPGNASTSVREQ